MPIWINHKRSKYEAFSNLLVTESTLYETIIATDTSINVIVVQATAAILKLKFLNTLLKESLIFLANILNIFTDILSFRIIF